MNERVATSLLVLGPLAFGLCAAALMFRFFDIVLSRQTQTKGDPLADLFKILGWFVGNGAIILGPLLLFNLSKAFALPSATADAFLSYLLGFGVLGVILAISKRGSLIQSFIYDLRKDLNDKEINAILLIIGYSEEPEEAARMLKVSPDEIGEILTEALTKLQARSERIQKSLGAGDDDKKTS